MSLKKFMAVFGVGQKPHQANYKQLWDDAAYKYTIHQIVEDIKNDMVFAKSSEERERIQREFEAVQRVTFKMQQLYNDFDPTR